MPQIYGIRTSGYRTHIEYDKIKQGNREKATKFHWQLIMTKKPVGVYFPTDEQFAIRLVACDPPETPVPELSTVDVHGYTLQQYGLANPKGEFKGTIEDFIDSSFEYAFREMVYSADRPGDHTAKPKEELLWDGYLMQFNNQDIPIRKWVFKDALLSEFNFEASFDGSKDLLGNGTITWTAPYQYQEQLNLSLI